MKNKYKIICVLMLISLVGTAVCIAFMPDKVPMHYNMAGQVDRIGSKYEQLILPLSTILLGIFWIAMSKYQSKKGDTGNEKVLLISGIVTLVLFDVMNAYFLYSAFSYTAGKSNDVHINLYMKIISIGIGLLMCVIGNIFPKLTLNSAVGIRTPWSMKNEQIWFKSQRFGAVAFIAGGIVIIIASVFLSDFASMIFALTLLLVLTIGVTVASYVFYKNDLKNN